MLRKVFGISLCFIILMIILVLVLEYHSTNKSRVIIENNIEYQNKIDSIKIINDKIDSLKYKLEYDKIKINNLDDSATIQLFLELVKGD